MLHIDRPHFFSHSTIKFSSTSRENTPNIVSCLRVRSGHRSQQTSRDSSVVPSTPSEIRMVEHQLKQSNNKLGMQQKARIHNHTFDRQGKKGGRQRKTEETGACAVVQRCCATGSWDVMKLCKCILHAPATHHESSRSKEGMRRLPLPLKQPNVFSSSR